MAHKRFTDTEIWRKPWFRKLTPAEKCAVRYILDNCDSVGVWDVDTELAEMFIGGEVNWYALPEKCNGNIRVISERKWWLVDFCEFQYGALSEDSAAKPIQSYVRQLKRHGLWEGYSYPMNTLQEKEKEKEKDKEGESVRGGGKPEKARHGSYVLLTPEEYTKLCERYGKRVIDSKIEDVDNYIGIDPPSRTKKYKNHYRVLLTWIKRDIEQGKLKPPPEKRRCPECGAVIFAENSTYCPTCGATVRKAAG